MIRERLIETLDKFIIMDDVTLTDDTRALWHACAGRTAAAKIVRELTGDRSGFALANLACVRRASARLPCTVITQVARGLRERRISDRSPSICRELWNMLLEKTTRGGRRSDGLHRAERVCDSSKAFPGSATTSAKSRFRTKRGCKTRHISYTKGCYTGQEIVERVRSRGQVNRRRVELIFSGTGVPSAGDALSAEGKEVGFVTRASALPSRGFAIGMGYLRKENNAIGSEVERTGGMTKVSKFPDDLRIDGKTE